MDDIRKNILEDAFVGFWEWNIPAYTVQLSNAFRRMLGYEEGELENSPLVWQRLIFADDLGAVINNFIAHAQSRGKVMIDTQARYKHKNGQLIWIKCTGKVIEWDITQRPVLVLGINIDITLQKVAEEKLEKAENQLKQRPDGERIGEWEFDLVAGKLKWSAMVKQIYEVPADFEPVFDAKTRRSTDFVKDGDSREKLNEATRRAINNGTPYNLELKIITANGRELWVRLIGYTDFENGTCKRIYGTLQDIDSQKSILEELEISENQFRSAFENATIGMALVSPEGKWIKVNNVLCDLLGYSPDELMGKTFQEITHPDDLDEDLQLVGKLLENEIENYRMEKRYFHKSGRVVWVLLSVTLVRDKAGNPVHFVSQIENITQRRSTEVKLRESEAKYRRIFENVQDVFYQTDYDGIVTEISPSIENYAGQGRDQIIGTPVEDFFYYPADKRKIAEHLLAYGKITDLQVRLRTTADEPVFVSINVHNLVNGDGAILGFEGSMRDITERRKAEDALKTRDALLTKLSEHIPGAIFQFRFYPDGHSCFPFASGGTVDLFELSPDEIKDDSAPLFKRIHLNDFGEFYKSVISSYNSLNMWEHEFRLIIPEREIKWVHIIARPEQLHDKSVIWHGYVTDVTDKKVKENQLQNTIELVTEQNNRLINFAYIISHNLRTHSGYFEALVDLMLESEDEGERKELLSQLKNVSLNLSETILHLNDVVSIQTSISDQRIGINLFEYIEKTTSLLKINSNNREAIINNNVPSNFEINYNPAYMESILFNFLSNGIKYGKPGRQTVINVNCFVENEHQVLEIADNGMGIDMEKNGDKLFGMYKTFHGNADAKGIGLFITKNQIEAMGGRIEVTSAVDVGTTFKIYLS